MLIKPWPNTYTFTKSLAERAVQQAAPPFPVLIVRPSIIIGALFEPSPGWLDSLAAAGTLSLMVATGLTKYLVGTEEGRADLIPVDMVSNCIVAGSMWHAKRQGVQVMHSASSHLNPITWYKYSQYVLEYAKTNPFEQQFSTPRFRFLKTQPQYDVPP